MLLSIGYLLEFMIISRHEPTIELYLNTLATRERQRICLFLHNAWMHREHIFLGLELQEDVRERLKDAILACSLMLECMYHDPENEQ